MDWGSNEMLTPCLSIEGEDDMQPLGDDSNTLCISWQSTQEEAQHLPHFVYWPFLPSAKRASTL